MANEIFAARIKLLRQNKGLSLDQLAKELQINKSRVGMWESSGTIPREDVLIKLSQYFDVSTDYLLGNDTMKGNMPSNSEIQRLQRGLEKLNDEDLKRAEDMLKLVFKDIFEEDQF